MHDKPKHLKVDAAMLRHCFMSQEDLPFALKIKRASQGACQGPIPHPIALCWVSHLGGLFWHWIVLDPNRSYSFIYKIFTQATAWQAPVTPQNSFPLRELWPYTCCFPRGQCALASAFQILETKWNEEVACTRKDYMVPHSFYMKALT